MNCCNTGAEPWDRSVDAAKALAIESTCVKSGSTSIGPRLGRSECTFGTEASVSDATTNTFVTMGGLRDHHPQVAHETLDHYNYLG